MPLLVFYLRNMKQIKFNEPKNREDIENTIIAALKYDEVVSNGITAELWFAANGIQGDVCRRIIFSANVSVWNEEMQGEEIYNVVIIEYYVDSGSVDSVYSYLII